MKIKRKTLKQEMLDVYDITCPETSNFALANGCIVHNSRGSKDIADAISGSFYSCFQNMAPSQKPRQVEFAEKMVDELKRTGRYHGNSRASLYSRLV